MILEETGSSSAVPFLDPEVANVHAIQPQAHLGQPVIVNAAQMRPFQFKKGI